MFAAWRYKVIKFNSFINAGLKLDLLEYCKYNEGKDGERNDTKTDIYVTFISL